MSDMQKKQNFLQGTALLAMATAIVKVIGALYKIPLNAIIGEQGFGYFNTAYDIYNVLLMISTAGLPVAMSRMISQASSLDHYNQVRRIYHTARGIFLALGIAGSLLMTVFCRQLAAFQNQPDAWAAIGCLGPCVLLICVMSTYRGFFQGQGNMLPTSVSQVLEAVVKLIVGMGAALAILKMTNEIPLAAGGAILGVTASCLVSAIYLFGRFRKSYALLPRTEEEPRSYRETARGLLAIAIPITFGSAALQLMTMLETKIYMGQLLNLGYTQSSADTMRGVYGMCLTIFNMPCAFITPITISIIPAITSHLTLCGDDEAKATEESAVRTMGLISLPCAVGLAVLAEPIIRLLAGNYGPESVATATPILAYLGIAVVFNSTVLLFNAIMQAHGDVTTPVVNMLIGGIVKVVVNYILVAIPSLNIIGAAIGTIVCYVTITALDLIAMRRTVTTHPAVARNLIRPAAAAAIMGAATFFAEAVLRRVTNSNTIICLGALVIAVIVYAIFVLALQCITYEDCLLLPKGEKIAKILHIKHKT